jgi:hypothetical protein
MCALVLTLLVLAVQLPSQQTAKPGERIAPAVDFAAEVQPENAT